MSVTVDFRFETKSFINALTKDNELLGRRAEVCS